MQSSTIAIIGLGYVGLPTFVAVHQTGQYSVVGYTRNQKRIDLLNQGQSQIDEPSVDDYLAQHKGTLTFTANPDDLKDAQIFLICVPTPVHADFTPDYGPVIEATELIAPYVRTGAHVVLESTVNPGTCRELIIPLLEEKTKLTAGTDFNVAHCPERVNPGDKVWNIFNINRNIGSIDQERNVEIAQIYRTFLPDATINEVSSLEIAEATKIIENSFRDVNIAFVNELARSFDAMGIDVKETIDAAANKPFGFMAHYPGAGVGGHCIAVDPYYLIKKASLHGFDHKFLKLAREINNDMPRYAVDRLAYLLNKVKLPVNGTRIALLGLSYKPDIADLRNSPSFEIKKLLEKLGADLVTYDPHTDADVPDMKSALDGAQAVLVATAHQEFVKELPRQLAAKESMVKVVVDGRNCLDQSQLPEQLLYCGIGRTR